MDREEEHGAVARDLLTQLILTLFRVNNVTLAWGDRLVAPFGLTSARWQLLGAIAFAEQARPVSWLARDLGANRQNVQRIVNDLHRDGLVAFQPNPHHKRAHLVVLTGKGRDAYAAALAAYDPRAEELAAHFSVSELEVAGRLLRSLRGHIGAELDSAKRRP